MFSITKASKLIFAIIFCLFLLTICPGIADAITLRMNLHQLDSESDGIILILSEVFPANGQMIKHRFSLLLLFLLRTKLKEIQGKKK